MAVRQVFHHFGKQFQSDQKGMKRIVVEFARPVEYLIEDTFFPRQIPFEQRLRECSLVGEMLEKAAFGDADFHDQLFYRGGRETLVENCGLCRIHQPLLCIPFGFAFWLRHGVFRLIDENSLYRRYSKTTIGRQ